MKRIVVAMIVVVAAAISTYASSASAEGATARGVGNNAYATRFATPVTPQALKMLEQPVIFDTGEVTIVCPEGKKARLTVDAEWWRNEKEVAQPEGQWRISFIGTGCCETDPLHPTYGDGWIIAVLLDNQDPDSKIWIDSVRVKVIKPIENDRVLFPWEEGF